MKNRAGSTRRQIPGCFIVSILIRIKNANQKKWGGGSGFDPIGRGARPSSTDTRGDQNNSKESFPVLTASEKFMKLFILIKRDQLHCCMETKTLAEKAPLFMPLDTGVQLQEALGKTSDSWLELSTESTSSCF
ncbi:hypothetical protein [Oligoflexus tunisiensis]|uniref:hypothetical protein n=1 Tax=Oligoflexus tunisiensis TaxID=708132 RepID=UPI00114D099B|nr:hypothetical protein [Oligoflexus tunisiensis]